MQCGSEQIENTILKYCLRLHCTLDDSRMPSLLHLEHMSSPVHVCGWTHLPPTCTVQDDFMSTSWELKGNY